MVNKLIPAAVSCIPMVVSVCFVNELKDRRIGSRVLISAECLLVYWIMMLLSGGSAAAYYIACIIEVANIAAVSAVFCTGDPWKNSVVVLIVEMIANIFLSITMAVSPVIGKFMNNVIAGRSMEAGDTVVTFIMVMISSAISAFFVRFIRKKLPDTEFNFYRIIYLAYVAFSTVTVLLKKQYFMSNGTAGAFEAAALVIVYVLTIELIVMLYTFISRRNVIRRKKRIQTAVETSLEYFDSAMKSGEVKDMCLSGNIYVDQVIAGLQKRFQEKEIILDGFVKVKADNDDHEKEMLLSDALKETLVFSLEFAESYSMYRVIEKEHNFFVRVEFDIFTDDHTAARKAAGPAEKLKRNIRRYGANIRTSLDEGVFCVKIMIM